eukprot:7082490-Prymnesium_polylepis.1
MSAAVVSFSPPSTCIGSGTEASATISRLMRSPEFISPLISPATLSASTKDAKKMWVSQGKALVFDATRNQWLVAGTVEKVHNKDEWQIRLSPDGSEDNCHWVIEKLLWETLTMRNTNTCTLHLDYLERESRPQTAPGMRAFSRLCCKRKMALHGTAIR